MTNAIVGIDLADRKQMVVVCDHDSKVLVRKTFRCKAWAMGAALDWAADRVVKAGFAGITVACEPTGHRWRVLGQLAAERGMPFVCVQPSSSSWVRRSEDLTSDKTDEKDAVLIARLTAGLRCYLPDAVDHRETRQPRPPGNASPAPSPAKRASLGPASQGCAPLPGGRCGAACTPTMCTTPVTGT